MALGANVLGLLRSQAAVKKVLCTVDADQVSDVQKKALEAALKANYSNHLSATERLSILWCELPPAQGFTNYAQPCVSLVVIEAQDGLDQQRREAMLGDCAADWARVTGIPLERLMISVFDATEFALYMQANQRRLSAWGRLRFGLHMLRSLLLSKARRGVLAFHPNLGA